MSCLVHSFTIDIYGEDLFRTVLNILKFVQQISKFIDYYICKLLDLFLIQKLIYDYITNVGNKHINKSNVPFKLVWSKQWYTNKNFM